MSFNVMQLVLRPDVVEMHDVTSRDPKLLVHLKVRISFYLFIFIVVIVHLPLFIIPINSLM